MKYLLLSIALLALFAESSTAQDLPFDLYINNKKIVEPTYTGYFLPTSYEFKFKDTTGNPRIAKGVVYKVEENTKEKLCRFLSSNTAASNSTLAYSVNLEFEITSMTKFTSDSTIKLIDTLLRYSISFIHKNEMTNEEVSLTNANNSNIKIWSKTKEVTSLQGYNNKKDSPEWEIKNEDSDGKVVKWELVLVRGSRPVAVQNYKGAIADLSFFNTSIQKGDFFSAKITMDYTNSEDQDVVFYKIIKIK